MLDLELLAELRDLDAGVTLRDLVVIFDDGLAARLDAVAGAALQLDAAATASAAHALRGSAATLGAVTLAAEAAAIEDAARAGSVADAAETAALRETAARAVAALRAHSRSHPA